MSNQFDIAVIGAGPGGYIAALKAAQSGAKTAVIEKHYLGGTCLNYGCIPSKALLASAQLLHTIKDASALGITVQGEVAFDWPRIQKRKDKVVSKLRGGIKGLFSSHKVTLFQGHAACNGPGKLVIADTQGQSQSISTDKMIIASGSLPARIPGWPTDPEMVCTSDEALHWQTLPKQLLIVGGGVIGCEFACMMHEYGVQVTMVEMLDNLLPEMDSSLGKALYSIFTKRGITIFAGVKVEEITTKDGIQAVISNGQKLTFDKVLVATGRRPHTIDLNLRSIGLDMNQGYISVNERMQTSVKDIYAIGDVNGRCLLAHAASAQGVTAVEDALGKGQDFDLPIPNVVYTFPEIGSVGITTQQAQERKIPVRIGQFPLGHLGKAMASGHETGFVKVLCHREDNTLLGVHILGHNATEIIESACALLSTRASIRDLADMVFAHPTLGEAVKEAAEDCLEQALHLPPAKVTRMMADVVEA